MAPRSTSAQLAERNEAIVQARRQGLRLKAIASEYGLSVPSVSYILRRARREPRPVDSTIIRLNIDQTHCGDAVTFVLEGRPAFVPSVLTRGELLHVSMPPTAAYAVIRPRVYGRRITYHRTQRGAFRTIDEAPRGSAVFDRCGQLIRSSPALGCVHDDG